MLCQPPAGLFVLSHDGLDVVYDVVHDRPLTLLDVEVRVEEEVDGQTDRVLPETAPPLGLDSRRHRRLQAASATGTTSADKKLKIKLK